MSEQVRRQLQEHAERFYAREGVQYAVTFEADDLTLKISQWLYGENSKVLARSVLRTETEDAYACAIAALSAMAVRANLDPPRPEPHRIAFVGSNPDDSLISIDGHNLQSLYSAKFEVDMESQYKVTLGFVAPFAHLDVDVLPQNLTLNVEGLYAALEMLGTLNAYRNRRFEDMDYAKTHSTEEETQLYKDVNELLRRYSPSTPA